VITWLWEHGDLLFCFAAVLAFYVLLFDDDEPAT
jgi:hypothetical protein